MKQELYGLTTAEAQRSALEHGDNSLKREARKSFFRKFLDNLCDPIIKILLLATAAEVILTFGHCNFFEVGGILLAVLIAATVSTVSEEGSQRAFARIQAEAAEGLVRVMRDGATCLLPVHALVIGDVVYMSAGERIPADGVVIDGCISVDQSALNGESKDVEKRSGRAGGAWELSDRACVFRGSVVTNGECVMRVMRVGEATYYGTVAKDVQTQTRESPLKLRLSKLAKQISRIGYFMAALVALTYLFNTFVVDQGFVLSDIVTVLRDPRFVFSSLIHALTLTITVIVVAVPEGLPMMITVVLSANMKRMMKDGVLVKKPVGIETAGSLNLLFTDKTGTLTTGKLSCERILSAEGVFRTAGALRGAGRVYDYLLLNAKYNTDCRLSANSVIGGNGTDRAVATFFLSESMPDADVQRKIPFTSDRKYASVTIGKQHPLTLIKGAPERLLPRCTGVLRADGNVDSGALSAMQSAYRQAAGAGERVIAVCVLHEGVQLLVALLVLKDSLRRGVKDVLDTLHGAGVQVVMMTGDSLLTACAIAQECGLYRPSAGHIALDCADLSSMSDEDIQSILPRLRVLARALPSDKRRLILLSQKMDLVVGMTGDGINDAPSLKLADVGFAMGSGADIAKDCADVVLLDDSLKSIENTVLYGRTIFSSIRKFITFQLMMNLAACGVSLVGQFIGIDSPITIVQMLWVNIIMDTLGGLAFAGEAPLPACMKEKPKKRTEPLLNRQMLTHILLTGGYTLLICILFLKLPMFSAMFRPSSDRVYFLTGFYALFIFSGVFNCFNARSERLRMFAGLSKNRPFIVIMLLIAAMQIGIIYFGGTLFRAAALTFDELIRVIWLAAGVLPFDLFCRILLRLYVRPRKPVADIKNLTRPQAAEFKSS